MRDFECIRTATCRLRRGRLLRFGFRFAVLLGEDVNFVLHVGKIGEFIIEVAVEKLDPEHQLALLVLRNQIVEKLETGNEKLLVYGLLAEDTDR